MGWKEWPLWVKGIIVGFVVGIVLLILEISIGEMGNKTWGEVGVSLFTSVLLITIIFTVAGVIIRSSWSSPTAKGVIIGLVSYIVIVGYAWFYAMVNPKCTGLSGFACGYAVAWSIMTLWVAIPLGALIGWIVGKIKKKGVGAVHGQ